MHPHPHSRRLPRLRSTNQVCQFGAPRDYMLLNASGLGALMISNRLALPHMPPCDAAPCSTPKSCLVGRRMGLKFVMLAILGDEPTSHQAVNVIVPRAGGAGRVIAGMWLGSGRVRGSLE